MEISKWKREPLDLYTILEVSSEKAKDALVLFGAKLIGEKVKPGFAYHYWILEILDIRVDLAIQMLREMKAKGVDFDK